MNPKPAPAQNLLAARHGGRTVTLGLDDADEIRRLSDARLLTCPGCGTPLVLHAGPVRTAHFAHLPGAACRLPQTEPETEEHRAGKLALARWLRARLPEADIIVEAFLPETNQRADVLALLPGSPPRRLVFEFQCANLIGREWRRRHRQYRGSGCEDLWILGGSRLNVEKTGTAGADDRGTGAPQGVTLRTSDLERALLWDGAPLLFLDANGARFPPGTLTRFRPAAEAQALRPHGRLSARLLSRLDVPLDLFAWPTAHEPLLNLTPLSPHAVPDPRSPIPSPDHRIWDWLAARHHVTPDMLPAFFGLELPGAGAFTCGAQAWQAAVYYRFVHRRVGDSWWLEEVTAWAQAYLPLVRPLPPRRLQATLRAWQEALAAAGFLSMPVGYSRASARVVADLNTLPAPPDRDETLRLVRYRATLLRDR